MNFAKAINLLVAAKEDAVLAAWTYMILELQVAPAPDTISPHDAWEAYQRFYDLGLISAEDFRRTDPERTFFAHAAKPQWGSVQDVLHRFKSTHEEPPMTTKSRITNPFATDDTALANRSAEVPAAPAGRGSSMPLSPFGTATAAALQNPFVNMGLGESKRPDQQLHGNPFSQESSPGLPCRDPQGTVTIEGRTFEPEVYCCKRKLDLASDGGQVVGPDDLPGNSVSVIDAIFHAHCPFCERVWHISVGETISQDSVR